MKAFFILAASCFLCTGLAALNHGRQNKLRAQKHHKASESILKVQDTLPPGYTKVGSMNRVDPTQPAPCPTTWYANTPSSCGRLSQSQVPGCDSVLIPTNGVGYQKVCGRFLGYQIGTPDAFNMAFSPNIDHTIEGNYVDGISITYGLPGCRHHIFSYAAGLSEQFASPLDPKSLCPCANGNAPPLFVGSSYNCESGNPNPTNSNGAINYSSDLLWDGQQCGGLEGTCCTSPNLPYFCTTLPTVVFGDIEIRLCTDEGVGNEDIALQFYELYIK